MTLAKSIELTTMKGLVFINLTNRQLAEYEIVFRVNDGFSLKRIGDFIFKEQLLFQRFKNKNQQLNLMLIDSVFPIILADLALLVILGKVKNLNDYLISNERIIFPQILNDKIYFERKIMDFMNGLLYGEVGEKDVWNGDTDNNRVFCIKNTSNELDFYSIYERSKLLELLNSKMKIENSLIEIRKRNEVRICLKFIFK